MSALAQLSNITHALTVTGAPSSVTMGGVLNTDHKLITMEPFGIDKNGVAKWRYENQTQASNLWLSVTYSHKPAPSPTGKTATKLIVTLPYTSGSGATTVTKVSRCTFSIDSFGEVPNLSRVYMLDAILSSLMGLKDDIINGRTVY